MFSRFANWMSRGAGHPNTSVACFALTMVWLACGLPLHFSLEWQVVMGTASAVVTTQGFFLIQHTAIRSERAIQLKLDEMVMATKDARNELIGLENKTDDEVEAVRRAARPT